MTVQQLLKTNIKNYIEPVPADDVFTTDSKLGDFLVRLRTLTKSDIRVQDLLLIITKNSVPLAEIDFSHLEEFSNFLSARIDDSTKNSDTTISKLDFYEELISKFGAVNNLSIKDKVQDAILLFTQRGDLLTITVVDEQDKVVGKIKRNNFLDKIISEIKK